MIYHKLCKLIESLCMLSSLAVMYEIFVKLVNHGTLYRRGMSQLLLLMIDLGNLEAALLTYYLRFFLILEMLALLMSVIMFIEFQGLLIITLIVNFLVLQVEY